MDLKDAKEKIRKRHFSFLAMISICIVGITGVFLIANSGILDVQTKEMLYECISQNKIMLLCGILAIAFFVWGWKSFFMNMILPPKKDVLYLHRYNKDKAIFLDQNGKQLAYEPCNKRKHKFYFAMKTRDYVYAILEECDEPSKKFPIDDKKSYWLNLYTSIGNFENVLILPLVYIALLPGLGIFINADGYLKLYGVLLGAGPLYVIVYDLIYKIKLSRNDKHEIDNSKLVYSSEILKRIMYIFGGSLALASVITTFSQLDGFTSTIIFAPFLLGGLCISGFAFAKAFNNGKLGNIFIKLYIIMLIIYLFIMIIYGTISIAK